MGWAPCRNRKCFSQLRSNLKLLSILSGFPGNVFTVSPNPASVEKACLGSFRYRFRSLSILPSFVPLKTPSTTTMLMLPSQTATESHHMPRRWAAERFIPAVVLWEIHRSPGIFGSTFLVGNSLLTPHSRMASEFRSVGWRLDPNKILGNWLLEASPNFRAPQSKVTSQLCNIRSICPLGDKVELDVGLSFTKSMP